MKTDVAHLSIKLQHDALFMTHGSKTSNLFQHLKTAHPESHEEAEQKQVESRSPAPPLSDKRRCRRVFRDAKHIQVQITLFLVINSAKDVAMVMFFLRVCLSTLNS